MGKLSILFVAIIGFFLASAYGQTLCGTPKAVADRLRFLGETMRGYGLDGAGTHVQLFVSRKGSWTITVRPPGGPTCVDKVGKEWQIFAPIRPKGYEEKG